MEVDKQRIAELVTKIQSGDNSAFNELYKLTSERAYFVALEFTKNNQDAEDILQESYIKALSKIKELDKPESFSSWLNQIIANKSKDFLKKKKPVLFEAEENEVFEVLPDEDTSFSPEENLDQTELQKTVMEVLDELSKEKRACVLMMYFEELSVGEIAETLEIPEGTVKTRLFSARKDLKEKFAKRGITSTFSVAPMNINMYQKFYVAFATLENDNVSDTKLIYDASVIYDNDGIIFESEILKEALKAYDIVKKVYTGTNEVILFSEIIDEDLVGEDIFICNDIIDRFRAVQQSDIPV